MLFTIFLLFYLGSIVQSNEGSPKTRCAVVIYVNQSSFNSEADFSDYVEKIQGLSSNRTRVYFSEDPDLFIVRHGRFIDAPGLFALESQKFPGMFLRKANHLIVLDYERRTEDFRNDATFLMDHTERNETYTTLKLFSHRSWRLSTPRDSNSPLFFDDYKDNMSPSRTSELLVVAQPCPKNVSERKQEVVSKHKSNVQPNRPEIGSRPHSDMFRDVTMKPPLPTDATLNVNPDTKYLTAITNKGSLKSIPNEYSFDNFVVPDFIMNSLTENAKSANDGVEAPKPEVKPANVVENKTPQQLVTEHTNKLPTTKQKISELSSLIHDPDIDDIENNLKNLQYGSKGCKLLVAEDTLEEDAASKDNVPNPNKKKACKDEFPQACMEMAKKGYCLAFKSLMSSVCRRSCNLCPRFLDTGFTSCTKTCGGGRQMRMIKINRREYLQTRRCNDQPCAINGGYSEFGPYTECSVTCGEGVKYRRRTCTHPKPQYNGKSCRRLGPSIESRPCHAEPCPLKHGHRKKPRKTKTTKVRNSRHHKITLHIDGPHLDKVHQHSILLKGKKVAKLRCTPKRGALRNIIQDSRTKRFTIHPLKKKLHSSKKSSIQEKEIVYNREGLPVDTAKTIIKAFKSPYKIILARKGSNDMKLLEECIEDDDRLNEEDGIGKNHGGNFVYTKPDEKSYSDFDEYQYEAGNIVTPQITSSHDNEEIDYSSIPKGNFFGEPKSLNFVLSKMNSISPRVNDELSKEQNLESTFKMENARPTDAYILPGAVDTGQEGDDANSGKESYGYNVEALPNR